MTREVAPNPFILALYSSTCPPCLTQSQSVTLESPTPSASSPAPAPTRLWRRTLWPQRLDALGTAGGEVGIDVEVRAVEVLVVVGDGESGADSQPTRTDGGVAPKNVQSTATCIEIWGRCIRMSQLHKSSLVSMPRPVNKRARSAKYNLRTHPGRNAQ